MFLSHKSNVIQAVGHTEHECRKQTKGMTNDEYNAWVDSITTVTGTGADEKITIDYSGETYTVVETIDDENLEARLLELGEYIAHPIGSKPIFNIKYHASKQDAEEILDDRYNSFDPKQYVQSHFVGDDDAKDARLLADEWVKIRAERDERIAETDWMMLSDTGTVSAALKNYRKALREIPQSQDSVKTFADIDWPDKPSS